MAQYTGDVPQNINFALKASVVRDLLDSEEIDFSVAPSIKKMELLYPLPQAKIYVPVQLNETVGQVVFRAVHRNPNATVYWHLNQSYLANTRNFHELALSPPTGSHVVILVDDQGHRLEGQFTIIGKDETKRK